MNDMATIVRVNLLVSDFDRRVLESLDINVVELCRDRCREAIRSEMMNRTKTKLMVDGVHINRVLL